MKNTNLVSAIITTHNRISSLKKAINSVRNQTYENIEIIVVDDGSNDGTDAYCRAQDDIKYIYIPPKEHQNGNYARNLGIKASNGGYIAFLDDDDEWMPTKIARQYKKMSSNECGIVYVGRRFSLRNGERKFDEVLNVSLAGDLSKKVFYNIFSTTSCIMVKREVLDDIGYFDENVEYWQEYELLTRICQKYKVALVNKPLVIYAVNYADKQRLSNKIDGFKKSVKYINKKYEKEIHRLSECEMRKRKKMIYDEIATRYDSAGRHLMARKYLWKSFCIIKTPKTFAKWMLGYTTYRKMKLKSV